MMSECLALCLDGDQETAHYGGHFCGEGTDKPWSCSRLCAHMARQRVAHPALSAALVCVPVGDSTPCLLVLEKHLVQRLTPGYDGDYTASGNVGLGAALSAFPGLCGHLLETG